MNRLKKIAKFWLSVAVISPCVAFVVPDPGHGADRSVTLLECLKLTLDYSRNVLIAEEGKKTSEGRYIEERSAALPNLSAEARLLRSHDDSLSRVGLTVEKNDYYANLNLTQALFTWGQIGAAIRAATHDKAASEQLYREAKQLALREAATSFFDLLLTLELEKVARDNAAQKRRAFDETARKHQMEVATDYDVLAARVALTNAEPALARAENDIRLAHDRLRYYMGIEEDFQAVGGLNCDLRPPEPLSLVLDRAMANRPEIAYYESRVGVFKELVTVAKGGDKPRVDLKGNVGWMSSERLGNDYPGQHWDVGLYLSYPLFDGLRTKGRVIQAKSQLATTTLEMERLLDTIALDARAAINNVDEAVRIAKGLEDSVTQASRLLEMAEAGYGFGVKTKLEVDDAQLNLVQSRVNLARARRDYLVARTRLLWIMGEDLQEALASPDSTCKAPPPKAESPKRRFK